MEYEEIGQSEEDIKYQITGEKGYRTTLTGHGVKHGDFYFEVEVLQPKIPLPHVGVKPALRVGFCNFEEQNLELPLGIAKRSYAYCSNGRMISSAKYRSEQNNEAYGKYFPIELTLCSRPRRCDWRPYPSASMQARIYA